MHTFPDRQHLAGWAEDAFNIPDLLKPCSRPHADADGSVS